MKIIIVAGARPNFIKIAPIMHEMSKHGRIYQSLVHTGQHYDYFLSQSFFKDLSIPKPDIYLKVGSHSNGAQTGLILRRLEKILIKERPDLVIVVGDVNSTLAGALCAAKLHIPIAHIEAGLRSFDRRMPEEINRILTDAVSDYLFTDSEEANKNLCDEGVDAKKIFYVGNVMIDTLVKYGRRARSVALLKKMGLIKRKYCLLTLHRPENVDNEDVLNDIMLALEGIQKKIKVVFPMHPRTQKMIKRLGFSARMSAMPNLKIVGALGYMDFIALMKDCAMALTDSGGVQEEAAFLDIPCLTLRDTTERPVTVSRGTNVIVGRDPNRIFREADKIMSGRRKKARPIRLWDGKAAGRIVKILLQKMNKIERIPLPNAINNRMRFK